MRGVVRGADVEALLAAAAEEIATVEALVKAKRFELLGGPLMRAGEAVADLRRELVPAGADDACEEA